MGKESITSGQKAEKVKPDIMARYLEKPLVVEALPDLVTN